MICRRNAGVCNSQGLLLPLKATLTALWQGSALPQRSLVAGGRRFYRAYPAVRRATTPGWSDWGSLVLERRPSVLEHVFQLAAVAVDGGYLAMVCRASAWRRPLRRPEEHLRGDTRARCPAPRRHHRALPRHEPDLGGDATISFRGVTTIAARWFSARSPVRQSSQEASVRSGTASSSPSDQLPRSAR